MNEQIYERVTSSPWRWHLLFHTQEGALEGIKLSFNIVTNIGLRLGRKGFDQPCPFLVLSQNFEKASFISWNPKHEWSCLIESETYISTLAEDKLLRTCGLSYLL